MHCNLDGVGWGGVGWGGGVVGNLPKCPQRREFIELIGFTRLSGAQVPASEDDNQISLVRSSVAETSITVASARPTKSILKPQSEALPRRKRLQQRERERARNSKQLKRTRKGKRQRPDFHFAPPSTVSGIPKWRELSIGELTGQILINLTWYQYFNVCRYDHVRKILTDDHKNLPIFKDLAILKLVSRTGNFFSSNQLVFNVRRLLNIFCIWVYNSISKSIKSHLPRSR
jgi:hypothetical protein